MKSIRLTIKNPNGLHARPLALFVQVANLYKATTTVTLRNVTLDGPTKAATSVLNVLILKVKQGNEIEVTADGPDEDAALAAIRTAVESGLGEPIE